MSSVICFIVNFTQRNFLMRKFYHDIRFSLKLIKKASLLIILVIGSFLSCYAQCPSNLDFEMGDFTGWQCYTGTVAINGGVNVMNLIPSGGPIPGRHTMLSATPGDGDDPYGRFPRNCPNGSGNSIQLGDATVTAGTTRAQGVSYLFTIPAGQNEFNLIYQYAVVFREGAGTNHSLAQQARFNIEIRNVTDNTTLGCSSFTFVATSGLPGFFSSAIDPTVKCKDWSAASINLNGNAGKTIEIFFKTSTCTPSGHFGYAYIDINTECSSSFVGATYCPDDAFVNVTGPFGYQTYTWWNSSFTTILGNTQTLNFTPPPPAGTIVAVVIDPYNGYGCRDTLYAQMLDTLSIQAQAGPDRLSCNNNPVQLGAAPRPRYLYSWLPVAGLSNPNIANPIASPNVTTEYIVTTTSDGGGCATKDTVWVNAAVIDTTFELIGSTNYCIDGTQFTTLKVLPHDSIQWYRNSIAIPGANQTLLNVIQSGTYHATLFSFVGCNLSTSTKVINIYPTPEAGFFVDNPNQCHLNNQFIFTDTSKIASGTINYSWNMGDGNVITSQNVTHSYAQPGTYNIELIITSDNGCKDTASFSVTVHPLPAASFNASATETCFKNHQFIFTNTSADTLGNLRYLWNMGDGNTFTTRNVTHTYAVAAQYDVKLLITTDIGCVDSLIIPVAINPSPSAGFTVNTVQQCFNNNQFVLTDISVLSNAVVQYLWNLGDGNTASTQNVTHNYSQPGDYIIKLLLVSDKGCNDSLSIPVKVFPFAIADFLIQPICTNIRLPLINKTINNTNGNLNYLWGFGNGQTSIDRSPIFQYTTAGIYNVSLTVNNNQCPQTITVKSLTVNIDAPAAGINYPVKEAIMNFSERLTARPIGNNVIWYPPTSLDNRFSYAPNFRGLNPQLYTIQLKTVTGCITVDTQFVNTRKKIEIYVPTGFSPSTSAGENDFLRPTLMGFSKVNYFRVYNRWGKLLFQMKSDRPGWDGKVNGVVQEMQTLVWMIEAEDIDGKLHKRQGTTILIR